MTNLNQMFPRAVFLALFLVAPLAQGAPPPAAKAPAKPAAATAAAPNSAGIGKGDTEIGVFGNFTTYDDTDLDMLILGVSVGKFLSDKFELRVAPAILWVDAGGTSIIGVSTVVSGEFLFRSGGNPVVPFVGAGIGLNITNVDTPTEGITSFTLNLGPTGGVKFFMSERYSLELAASYLLGIGTSCGSIDCSDLTSDTLQTTFRFNFYN